MIAKFIAWLVAFFVGRKSGEEVQQADEQAQFQQVETDVRKADQSSPVSRSDLDDRLRDHSF